MARYARYTELLSRWSRQADTTPELVEKWLVRDWRHRATAGVVTDTMTARSRPEK